MWTRLKNQPLAGLALAICAGLVAARLVLLIGKYIIEEWLPSDWTNIALLLFLCAIAAGAFYIVRFLYRRDKRKTLYGLGTLITIALVVSAALAYNIEKRRSEHTIAIHKYVQQDQERYRAYLTTHPGASHAEFALDAIDSSFSQLDQKQRELKLREIEATNPFLARQLSDPEFAALATLPDR